MDTATTLNLTMSVTAAKAADMTSETPRSVIQAQFIQTLTTGTGANQCDLVYADSATMIADAFAPYALDAAVKDIFGDNVVFARIKGVYVKNTSTTASIIKVGGGTDGAGLNAWDTWTTSTTADGSEGVLVPAGGFMFIWAPGATAWTVAAGNILSIEEMSTLAASFDLVILGSTA